MYHFMRHISVHCCFLFEGSEQLVYKFLRTIPLVNFRQKHSTQRLDASYILMNILKWKHPYVSVVVKEKRNL